MGESIFILEKARAAQKKHAAEKEDLIKTEVTEVLETHHLARNVQVDARNQEAEAQDAINEVSKIIKNTNESVGVAPEVLESKNQLEEIQKKQKERNERAVEIAKKSIEVPGVLAALQEEAIQEDEKITDEKNKMAEEKKREIETDLAHSEAISENRKRDWEAQSVQKEKEAIEKLNLAEESVRSACQKIIDLWKEDAGWALRFVGEKPTKNYLDESISINSRIRELANALANKKSESEKIKNKFIKFGLGKIEGEMSKIEDQINTLSGKLQDLDKKQKEARDNYAQLRIEAGEALIGYEKILRSVGQDLKSKDNYSIEKKFPFALGKFDNDGREVFSIDVDKMFKIMGYDRQIE